MVYRLGVTIIGSFFIFLQYTHAQTTCHLRLGPNFSTIYTHFSNYSDHSDPLVHYHVGFGVDWTLTKFYQISAGMYYSGKGQRNISDGTIPVPRHLILNYMAFPVSLNRSILNGFHVGAGVEIDYLILKRVGFGKNSNMFIKGASQDWDFGWLVQVKYRIKVWELGLTGYYGLTRFVEHDKNNYLKNRTAQIYVAYVIQ